MGKNKLNPDESKKRSTKKLDKETKKALKAERLSNMAEGTNEQAVPKITKKSKNKKEKEETDEIKESDEEEPQNDPSCSEYTPSDVERSRKRKQPSISTTHQTILQDLTKSFTTPFHELNLIDHPAFKDQSPDYMKKVKNYCHYRHSKAKVVRYDGGKSTGIMEKLLNERVEDKHRQIFTETLEQFLPRDVQRYYLNKELDETLQTLKKIIAPSQIAEKMQSITPCLLLKASLRYAVSVIDRLWNDDYKTALFYHCVKPALQVPGEINYRDLDKKEYDLFYQLCKQNQPQQLTDVEAYLFMKILQYYNLFNLDEIYSYFMGRDEKFWKQVLIDLCQVKENVSVLWIKHQDVMMTQAMLQHYQKFSMSETTAAIYSRFERLTEEDISDLFQLQHWRNFCSIVALLDESRYHDFKTFKNQAETYLKLEKKQQIAACGIYLKNLPLQNWSQVKNKILASDNFVEDEYCLQIVQQAVQSSMKLERVGAMTKEQERRLQDLWDEAFLNLNKVQQFIEHSWQKELVTYLVYAIAYNAKKNIIVSLGTGHGKSVIIQLLADILCQFNNKVIVVCLNHFLAHWGRYNFGSHNVQSEKIQYLSLQQFIQRKPSPNVIVLYDEIDQMLGSNSFDLVEDSMEVKAIYKASLMREWKALIGFSGTVSMYTLAQIRAELRDPICLEIPSLRKNGSLNKISKVIKSPDDSLIKEVHLRMLEVKHQYSNFIIILDNPKKMQSLASSENLRKDFGEKNILIIDDFTKNFSSIEKSLKQLTKGDFIVITNLDGARGIDYKGLDMAHVIIGHTPTSYSQCVQALGRGCRDLSGFAEGTIICSDPLTLEASEYLSLQETCDAEKAEALKLNAKVARMLHNKTVPKSLDAQANADQMNLKPMDLKESEVHLALLIFRSVMTRNENFENMEHGLVLWKCLRKLDSSQTIPHDFYQEWNK